MFFKLAWRNTFKNKKRTIIAGTAIGLGIAFLMFYDGLIEGMTDNMYSAATELFTGHAQIHNAKFRESYDAKYTIENYHDVVSKLEKYPAVKDFTERTMSYGMITSSSNVNSVTVVGVVPETERKVSKIDDAIIEGRLRGAAGTMEMSALRKSKSKDLWQNERKISLPSISRGWMRGSVFT